MFVQLSCAYDAVYVNVAISVPKLDENESGPMVLEKVS